MPIYAWDELYFFKGSYLISQWSRQVIHRKRLFKDCKKDWLLETLFDEPTTKIFFPVWSREQIFTRLSDRYAENIVGPAWLVPVRSNGPAYFDMSALLTLQVQK